LVVFIVVYGKSELRGDIMKSKKIIRITSILLAIIAITFFGYKMYEESKKYNCDYAQSQCSSGNMGF